MVLCDPGHLAGGGGGGVSEHNDVMNGFQCCRQSCNPMLPYQAFPHSECMQKSLFGGSVFLGQRRGIFYPFSEGEASSTLLSKEGEAFLPNSGSKRGIFCPRRGRERLSVRGAWESQFGKRQEQPAMQWGWHHLADNQSCSILVAVFWSKYYCCSIFVAVFWLKYSASVRTQECRSPFGTLLLIH